MCTSTIIIRGCSCNHVVIDGHLHPPFINLRACSFATRSMQRERLKLIYSAVRVEFIREVLLAKAWKDAWILLLTKGPLFSPKILLFGLELSHTPHVGYCRSKTSFSAIRKLLWLPCFGRTKAQKYHFDPYGDVYFDGGATPKFSFVRTARKKMCPPENFSPFYH